jgi:hypothetical protein
MTRIELATDPEGFEALLTQLGLGFTRMTLKKYPGATHWHIRKPGLPGTLEATWWPSEAQFWIEQRKGRVADWQMEVISRIVSE